MRDSRLVRLGLAALLAAVVLLLLPVGAFGAGSLSVVGAATDSLGHRLDGPGSIKVVGHYAYVAVFGSTSPSGGMTVVDEGDAAHPVIVGSVSDARLTQAVGIDVVGRYAYVTSKLTNTLTVIDVSTPSAPVVVGSVVDDTRLNGAYTVQVV